MSTAPAATAPEDAAAPAPKAGGKKKLLIIVGAALLLVLAGGGGAAFYVIKQRQAAAAAAAEGGEVQEAKPKKKKDGKKAAPVFLPLDIFTVNLADREAERYAQVGVTLELADSHVSDQLKAYMPAIRNDILMLLAHKRAEELQDRDGKLDLAREIKRAASKPLADADDHDAHAKPGDEEDEEPVRAVHFSAFIIQ
ncbi:MAG: flagellar basal body-associated FliL family protein [Burkholderiaceae bacterium]|nr:flagellar basal body-associated FliL family protein [Burkholderiaceae bacterium]